MADEQATVQAEERTREVLNTGTKEVAETHRFDQDRLAGWMKANIPGFEGPLEVR